MFSSIQTSAGQAQTVFLRSASEFINADEENRSAAAQKFLRHGVEYMNALKSHTGPLQSHLDTHRPVETGRSSGVASLDEEERKKMSRTLYFLTNVTEKPQLVQSVRQALESVDPGEDTEFNLLKTSMLEAFDEEAPVHR